MTYDEIYQFICLRLGGQTIAERFFPPANGEIKEAVKQASYKVAEQIDPNWETLFELKSATITGDGSTTQWDLSSFLTSGQYFLRAKSVVIGTTFIDYKSFRNLMEIKVENITSNQQYEVAISSKSLYIYPALSTGQTGTFYFYIYPTLDINGNPDVSLLPPSYHEAVALKALYNLGHKIAHISNFDPTEIEKEYQESFQLAQQGLNDGFADRQKRIVDIYYPDVDW